MTTPTILREGEMSTHFRKLSKADSMVAVAAPFWGSGAAKKLGLSKKDRGRARILCNLDQTGCNPRAIKKLFDLGLKIRSHPRLHAKIYAASKFAIVGSSNVSNNGLPEMERAHLASIEANVLCTDQNL